ncbi:transmembrane protein [Salix suchowensis]|nr:transmembrane protein [Salix suchowensis]
MSDWGPVFMAVVLFILLTPGLLFQVPGRHRCVEFGNFQTSGASIMVHTLLYFSLICVFLLAVKVHLYLGGGAMSDWGPVVLAVVLFVLLSPGLLFQLPGRNRVVEFGNMQTSGLSILVHTIIFFGLITIFLIAIGVHIYTG